MKTNYILKLALLCMVSLFQSFCTHAQIAEESNLPKNSMYVDASLGITMHAALNYERLLITGRKIGWYARIGGGAAGVILGGDGPAGLAAITMLYGKKSAHFEVNAGVFVTDDKQYNNQVIPLINAGFRYQKPDGGFVFRTFLGIYSVGLGLGYAF